MNAERHKRAKELFLEACEHNAGSRLAFITRACAGDDALKREVLALLEHDQADDGLAETALAAGQRVIDDALRSARSASNVQAQVSVANAPPESIGGHRIVRCLGEGGFGTVYLAEESGPIRRNVAIKVIKPGMDTRQVVARFEAERQTLALMNHAGIARVFAAGTTDGGRPYFVMEHVAGVPITEYCDQERLTIAQRLGLLLQVCAAVQHAHQKGVIHRDLKPSNMLVALIDGQPQTKIIDFGIAKAVSAAAGPNRTLTEEGQFVGTPAYMSPEQADGVGGLDIDTRTDVYSLGVVLYELLTGAPPFSADTFRRVGSDELRRIIREQEPQRPSTRVRLSEPAAQSEPDARARSSGAPSNTTLARASGSEIAHKRQTDPRTLLKQLRGDLDWITMKSIAKERARRYASVSELAADIERHLRHEPVLAGSPGVRYRLGKLMHKHRAAFAAAALVLLALIGGIIGTSWQAYRATQAELAAERHAAEESRQRRNAELEFERANAVNDLLRFGMGLLSPAGATRDELTVKRMLEVGGENVGTLFAGQPIAEAAARRILGDVFAGAFDLKRASQQYEQTIALLEAEIARSNEPFGRLHRDLIETLLARATISIDGGGGQKEFDQFARQAFRLGVQAAEFDHPPLVQPVRRLAAPYEQGRPQAAEALAVCEDIRAAVPREVPPRSFAIPAAAGLLACSATRLANTFQLGSIPQTHCRAAIELFEKCPNVPVRKYAVLYWAMLAGNADPPDVALAMARKLDSISVTIAPVDSFPRAQYRMQLGRALQRVGRLEEAEPIMLDCQQIIESTVGRSNGRTIEALEYLMCLYDEYRPEKSMELRDAFAERTGLSAPGGILGLRAMGRASSAGQEPRSYQTALASVDWAIARACDQLGADESPGLYVRIRGMTLYRLARYSEALEAFTDAPAGEGDLLTRARYLAFLAMTQHRLGRVEEARHTLTALLSLRPEGGTPNLLWPENLIEEASATILQQ